MVLKLILLRDGDFIKFVTGLTFGNTNTLFCDHAFLVLRIEIVRSMQHSSHTICFMTNVSLHKLELKILYVLPTVAVVTNDAHSSMLTQVVLALLKNDLRVTDRSSYAKKASNLTFYLNRAVDWFRLELWPLDVNHFCASEGRNSTVSISPIVLIDRCHLNTQTVLNFELSSIVVFATK